MNLPSTSAILVLKVEDSRGDNYSQNPRLLGEVLGLRYSAFFLLFFFSPILWAVPYVTGDSLDPVSLNDQHEKPGYIDKTTRLILFSRDKKGGEILTDALSNIPEGFLAEQNIVYITDISAMPGLISKYIAIPALQKKAYSILLDKDGSRTINYPDKKAMATLIYVESLSISHIIYENSIDAVIKNLLSTQAQ